MSHERGAIVVYPDDGMDAETLLETADTALLNPSRGPATIRSFIQQLTP